MDASYAAGPTPVQHDAGQHVQWQLHADQAYDAGSYPNLAALSVNTTPAHPAAGPVPPIPVQPATLTLTRTTLLFLPSPDSLSLSSEVGTPPDDVCSSLHGHGTSSVMPPYGARTT
ncbi:hypothetical protein EXIGLDRAFT_766269 [Exidia glandulosa HHB12029]|uniref:Uncharacterized protein n=1 Tax=Exidia glandulosa HHB12029 TaxID=1314781 RepID=A0A165JUN8_EXIGL|nr:hypothetical protein EXIGLDRAFT_766269 [Exidia glandulosa HHB12029]